MSDKILIALQCMLDEIIELRSIPMSVADKCSLMLQHVTRMCEFFQELRRMQANFAALKLAEETIRHAKKIYLDYLGKPTNDVQSEFHMRTHKWITENISRWDDFYRITTDIASHQLAQIPSVVINNIDSFEYYDSQTKKSTECSVDLTNNILQGTMIQSMMEKTAGVMAILSMLATRNAEKRKELDNGVADGIQKQLLSRYRHVFEAAESRIGLSRICLSEWCNGDSATSAGTTSAGAKGIVSRSNDEIMQKALHAAMSESIAASDDEIDVPDQVEDFITSDDVEAEIHDPAHDPTHDCVDMFGETIERKHWQQTPMQQARNAMEKTLTRPGPASQEDEFSELEKAIMAERIVQRMFASPASSGVGASAATTSQAAPTTTPAPTTTLAPATAPTTATTPAPTPQTTITPAPSSEKPTTQQLHKAFYDNIGTRFYNRIMHKTAHGILNSQFCDDLAGLYEQCLAHTKRFGEDEAVKKLTSVIGVDLKKACCVMYARGGSVEAAMEFFESLDPLSLYSLVTT